MQQKFKLGLKIFIYVTFLPLLAFTIMVVSTYEEIKDERDFIVEKIANLG